MNIIRITSGLGNQMFQYAFFCALREISSDTKMDISEFKHRKHHYGYELEKIFNIVPVYATRKEVETLADVSKDFFSDFRRKFLNIHLKTSGMLITEGEIGAGFHSELLHRQNTYFQGYWQTEKYFNTIKEIIKGNFTFKIELDAENRQLANQISTCNSVSIHIRRGDYMKSRRFHQTGSVCSPAYYRRAIDYIQSHTKDAFFFFFSDDIDWVKANLEFPNACYVENNKGKDSYMDMQLMSLCKHNIIANSSFSWWGAWLNSYSEKIVIAPDIWFRNVDMPDIIPDDWIRIAVD